MADNRTNSANSVSSGVKLFAANQTYCLRILNTQTGTGFLDSGSLKDMCLEGDKQYMMNKKETKIEFHLHWLLVIVH